MAVIGSDVSAQAFTAFLKHRMPSACITSFAGGSCQTPGEGVTFSSPWIRNDKKGRIAVLKLGREILGIGDNEFCVSKVNSSISIASDNNRHVLKIPSFGLIFRNFFPLLFEPFRNSHVGSDISVFDFLRLRFGQSFSVKYANILSSPFPSSEVSVHALFPKMAKHKSVLLGPLMGVVGSLDRIANADVKNVDVMDYLWQELMSGGKYVSMRPGLDFSLFFQELVRHIASVSVSGGDLDSFSPSQYDLVVSSQNPSELLSLYGEKNEEEWIEKMSNSKKVFSSRFFIPRKCTAKRDIVYSSGTDGVFAVIQQSSLYPENEGQCIVDVLSDRPMDGSVIGAAAVDRLIVNEEEIPIPSIGWNERMRKFNEWRIKQKNLQVVGKWYYCPSGSLTDVISDADRLAQIVAQRYGTRRIENERRSDWMTRNDRSLDFSYQDDSWSAHKL